MLNYYSNKQIVNIKMMDMSNKLHNKQDGLFSSNRWYLHKE